MNESARFDRVPIALALPLRGEEVLVRVRAPGEHLGGLWEFPGGKVEDGERSERAALRELSEETGLRATAAEVLVTAVFDYPDRLLKLDAFVVREWSGEVVDRAGSPWVWTPCDRLVELEMPPANAPIVRALRWRLRG